MIFPQIERVTLTRLKNKATGKIAYFRGNKVQEAMDTGQVELIDKVPAVKVTLGGDSAYVPVLSVFE